MATGVDGERYTVFTLLALQQRIAASAQPLDTILIALADYAKTGYIPPLPVRAMRVR